MSAKVLEISSGANLPPKRFEITEVEPNIFMLKTIESTRELVVTLEKWLQKYFLMGEPGYSGMLWERSSSMRQVLSEGIFRDLDVNSMSMGTSIACGNNSLDESIWHGDTFRKSVAGPRGNLEEMVEEADLADCLFIGGKKQLMQ
jgi:hypothetical protein